MDGLDNQTNQQPIAQAPLAGDKKPNFTIDSVIGLIFVVMILISWFWPVDTCRYYNCGTQVSDLIAWPMIIMGAVAGISFLVRVVKLTRGNKPVLRFFGILAGVGGGVFIFLVGLISGFIAELRAHPT